MIERWCSYSSRSDTFEAHTALGARAFRPKGRPTDVDVKKKRMSKPPGVIEANGGKELGKCVSGQLEDRHQCTGLARALKNGCLQQERHR